MLRLLLACVLGLGVFALVAWKFDLISPGETGTVANTKTVKDKKINVNLGAVLYPAAEMPPTPPEPEQRQRDPIIIQGNLVALYRPEIAAQIAGQVMFVGDEIPEGATQLAGATAFLAAPYEYVKVNHGAREVIKTYRLLKQGDIVNADDMLAMIDTAKAMGELAMKRVKITAAKADSDGAWAIAQEAAVKLTTAERQLSTKSIALEEYRSADLTAKKMFTDHISKLENWKQSLEELNMSQIIYKQHEIRNKNYGRFSIIQRIWRQRGEAVKDGDPVMTLLCLDPLGAEGQLDGEYSGRIRDGMLVSVEPSIVDSPPKTYRGHVAAVNCLAVTKDPVNPLIVSGSEDGSVLVWERFKERPIREFKHKHDAVKAMVVSPPGDQAHNLLLCGFVDGTIRLYNMAAGEDKALVKETRKHDVSVTALAFSPDGKYFASGAADGSIMLWTTDTVEPLFTFDEKHGVGDPHHGAVTALHFTPQCKLVSASLDKTLQVWSLKEKGAQLDYFPLAGRNGSISQNDVSSDGGWMLFDQGKTLQIRSVADGKIINTFQNPGGVIPFETLAIISPDRKMVLSAGDSEGRLQLWHVPSSNVRGFEIRKLAPPQRWQVSCAAFAPLDNYGGKGSFAVSANTDGQIYLWPLPSEQEVNEHRIPNLPLRFADGSINSTTRQRTIQVEVPNPPTKEFPAGRLVPGRPVTIVID